jgi:hypothetical protein
MPVLQYSLNIWQHDKELEDALEWLDIKIRQRFHADYNKAYECMSNDTKQWIDKIQEALEMKPTQAIN